MNTCNWSLALAGVVACLGASAVVFAGTVPSVDVIAAEGQVPPGGDGSAITTFNPPFTNSLGQVGFTGNLASGERYVWHTDAVIWLNAFALPDHVLTGTEATMGISDDGGFIYSPSVVTDDGSNDAVYTHNGLLLQDGDPAPDVPGMFATFNSRPTMLPDGTAHWMAGLSTTSGGGTSNRIFYRASPAGRFPRCLPAARWSEAKHSAPLHPTSCTASRTTRQTTCTL